MKLRIDNKDLFTGKEHFLAFRAAWARNSNGPSAAQHLLYVILRGHDAYASFTPISNRTKLANGMSYTFGLHYAMQSLKRVAYLAKKGNDIAYFLSPFEDTITPETLIEACERCDDVPEVFASYGIGRLIHMKSEISPITYEDLWDMYEEVK